ncbi:MAG: hypothetical protein HC830_03320 [Bacteroidetes bacterium]|nr:hypothetical protein [Bacteroidota bacterium]
MKDLCIPLPNLKDNQIAQLEVTVGQEKLKYEFRVESFVWETDDDLANLSSDHLSRSLARITRLKNSLENYNKEWELIQIFTPAENSKFIQVLYRKRNS